MLEEVCVNDDVSIQNIKVESLHKNIEIPIENHSDLPINLKNGVCGAGKHRMLITVVSIHLLDLLQRD